jgi:hypothetical protein
MIKLKKKNIKLIKKKKLLKSTNLTYQTRNPDHEIKKIL